MPAEPNGAFRYCLDPVFLASAATYAVNRLIIKPNLHHYSPLFHGHLNDTLTVPVLLPLFLLFYRLVRLRPDDQPPRFWEVAPHFTVWILFFKWFGPLKLHVGIYDPVDMYCLFGEGIAAWFFWQRKRLVRLLK